MGVVGPRFQKPGGVPRSAARERVRCRGDGRHHVNFYGYRSELGVPFPAVRKNADLDDLFDDHGRLRLYRSVFDAWKDEDKLTPHVPSSCISLARFTRPYAPLPISRSTTYSEILRSVRKGLGSLLGVGAPTLATLRKLVALFERTSLVEVAGGSGCSI